VPIYFAPSWLLIAGLLTLYYGPVVGDLVPAASGSTKYVTAFAFAGLFAGCVLAHEVGHTAASLLLGTPVRRIVIFLLGGISEIVREPRRPREELLVALAGPAVSLLLAATFGVGSLVVPRHTVLGALVVLLWWSNLVVAGFNLLPGLPLDGGRALRGLVWSVSRSRLAGTRVAAWAGRLLAVAVAVGGLFLDRSSLGVLSGTLAVAMAAYLWFGASQALRIGLITERLPQIAVRDLLRPGLMVGPDVSVAEALRRVWAGGARGLVVLDGAEQPAAIVDESLIGAVPEEQRPWTPITAVARPLEPGLVLNVGLTGEDLMAAVRATPAHDYLVVDDGGTPAGILSVTDLAAMLQRPA
jgi:Zn-dependent protease